MRTRIILISYSTLYEMMTLISIFRSFSYYYYLWVFFFFFFQAEDGIRDAQESRGLGDVYKRQGNSNVAPLPSLFVHQPHPHAPRPSALVPYHISPVSYTHLTLPTKRIV
eukprot:TRINITY_DN908_c0_g1_i15.p1 TRINITY_DN908_c0_g1~~TRINITY_DN908_c0_g1_i15.p1  ORF type:complete len:110 (+),score=11.11 TRINITY_DN908_c0_g1_i15:15-344(+)